MAGLEHRIIDSYEGCGDSRPLPNRVASLWLVPKQKYTVAPIGKKSDAWELREVIEAESHDRIAALVTAATFSNQSAFLEALKSIAWDVQSAADFVRAIDLCLRVGAHLAARQLAAKGATIHVDSQDLQKYARILAPPTIPNRRPSIRVGPRANVEWLRTNRSEYKGKWIALKSGELIGSADSRHELTNQIGKTKGTGILITYI